MSTGTRPTLDLDFDASVPGAAETTTETVYLIMGSAAPIIENDGMTLNADGIAETATYRNVASVNGVAVDLVGYVIDAQMLDASGATTGVDSNPTLLNTNPAASGGDGTANVRFHGNSLVEMRWTLVEAGTDTPVVADSIAVLINDLDGNADMSRYERITVAKDQMDSYALESDPANPTNIHVSDDGTSITFTPDDADPGVPGARSDNSVALTFRNTSEFTITYEKLNSGGNVGLDGSFSETFFTVPTVSDTNPDFGNLFTEHGAPVALADAESAAIDTKGVGAWIISVAPDATTMVSGDDDVLVVRGDDDAELRFALDGAAFDSQQITVNGAAFVVSSIDGRIDITAVSGRVDDATLRAVLIGLNYENTAALDQGLDPVSRKLAITVTDAEGTETAPATATVQVVGVNDAPEVDTIASDTRGSVTEAGIEGVPGQPQISGRLVAADPDPNATVSWSAASQGTYGSLSIDPQTGHWTYTLDNSLPETDALSTGSQVTETFVVTLTDEHGLSATQEITILVNGDSDDGNGVVLTEDIWFAGTPGGVDFSGNTRTEWVYHGGSEKLELEVEIPIDAIFGQDTGWTFADVDIQAYLDMFTALGASELESANVDIKGDEIQLRFVARDVPLTDEEFAALPQNIDTPVQVMNENGNVYTVDVHVSIDTSQMHSPVVLDLSGDGAIGVTGNSTAQVRADATVGQTVWFDIDGNGTLDNIEWTNSDGDGFLVDNRDGLVIGDMDGARLFGDEGGLYEHGYVKLSGLDNNGDGTLTGSELDGLALWVDDGDAVVQANELTSVHRYGIGEVSVTPRNVVNAAGETLIQSFARMASGALDTEQVSGGGADDTLHAEGFVPAVYQTQAEQVYRLYQATLNRVPDAAGLESWTQVLGQRAMTLTEVADGFVESAEFENTYGDLDDAGFVGLLYQNVLGRTADTAGLNAWVALLDDGVDREEIVLGFSESDEFKANMQAETESYVADQSPVTWTDDVFRLYQATLGRAPDLGGLQSWVAALADGMAYDSVVNAFVESPEFQSSYGTLADDAFVALLYTNVLGRSPDADGQAAWVTMLQEGATRASVVEGFAQSPEFVAANTAVMTSWMRDQGIQHSIDAGGGTNFVAGGMMTDRFVFDAEDRAETTVVDLEPWDYLQFENFGYGGMPDAKAHMTEVDGTVVFEDQRTVIVFENTTLSQLRDDMFV